MIWTGTCGFGQRPAAVLRRLDAVEIQETFYRPVAVARAAVWRSGAPPDFRFCVKASRSITHATHRVLGPTMTRGESAPFGGFGDTRRVAEGWEATRAVAEAVRAEVIVFQTPSTFGPTDKNRLALYPFFESISTSAVRAIELPRSWATHITEKICEDLRLVHAVDPFEREPATYGLAYFRLTGRPRDRTRYSDDDLARLREICREYDDAFAMFQGQSAVNDALRFSSLLRE